MWRVLPVGHTIFPVAPHKSGIRFDTSCFGEYHEQYYVSIYIFLYDWGDFQNVCIDEWEIEKFLNEWGDLAFTSHNRTIVPKGTLYVALLSRGEDNQLLWQKSFYVDESVPCTVLNLRIYVIFDSLCTLQVFLHFQDTSSVKIFKHTLPSFVRVDEVCKPHISPVVSLNNLRITTRRNAHIARMLSLYKRNVVCDVHLILHFPGWNACIPIRSYYSC